MIISASACKIIKTFYRYLLVYDLQNGQSKLNLLQKQGGFYLKKRRVSAITEMLGIFLYERSQVAAGGQRIA